MKYLKDCIGEKDFCPSCNYDFKGEDIYEHFLEKYNDPIRAFEAARSYGWREDNQICFKKEIGIEIPGAYDGILFYKCPECKCYWRRFENTIHRPENMK